MKDVAKIVKNRLNENAESLDNEITDYVIDQRKKTGQWMFDDDTRVKMCAQMILNMMHKLDPKQLNQPKVIERFSMLIKKVQELHRGEELVDIICNNLD